MKKLLSLFLALILVFATVPLSAIPISAATCSGGCGENLTWLLDTDTGVLTISGTGEMKDYSYSYGSSNSPWYSYRSVIKKIVLPSGLTSIGDRAFYGCYGLTEITIPDSVTSIGSDAFYVCSNLKTVNNYSDLPIVKGSSNYGYAGYYADTVNWYVKKTGSCGTNLTYVFDGTTGTLTISGTGEMKDYSYSSYGSSNSPWYSYCSLIKKIVLPSGLTSIGYYAFYGCYGLAEITIPDSVTSIGDSAFYVCINLKTVNNYSDLPIVKGSSNYGCAGYYAETVNWYVEQITGSCGSNLKWSLSTSTGTLTISGTGAMTNYSPSSSVPWYSYRSVIKKIVLPSGLTSIGDSAFYGCDGLTEITIHDSVTSIGDSAFLGCSNLKTVNNYSDLPIVKGSSNYGYAGYYADTVNWYVKKTGSCGTNLTYVFDGTTGTLTISGTGEMKDYSYSYGSTNSPWYSYRSLIKKIVLPSGLTSIGDLAFYDCDGLTEITIPDSVTSIGDSAFEYCTGLTKVTIGKGVTSIGDYAFCNCSGLEKITVDANNTVYYSENNCLIRKSDKQLILGCKNSVIPNNVTSIGERAFDACDGLTEITIPDSVTSIGIYAFEYCTGLTKVTIGKGVTSIGDYAFYVCINLKTVNNYSDLPIVKGSSNYGYVGYYADNINNYITTPSAPTLQSKTDSTVTLTKVAGYEYKCGNGAWQTSNVFTGLLPNTTYSFYQRVAETDTAYASESSTAFSVTTISSVPSSTTSSTYKVSGTTISKITAGTTVSKLLSGLSAGQHCKVYRGSSAVSGTAKIGTGMQVKIMDGSTVKATYTVVVTGDTNGDGNITVTDMLAIKAHVLKKSTLSGAAASAADTSGDGAITITDFIQTKAKILGKGNIVAR